MAIRLAERERTRTVVTGASGFLGQAVVNELAKRGMDVVGLSRSQPPHGTLQADWEQLDLASGDIGHSLGRLSPDTIIHCAGHGGEPQTDAARRACWTANLFATERLLGASATRPGVQRIVVVSSAAIYGPMTADQPPIDEDASWRPAGVYGAAKAAATMLASIARLRDGLPVSVAVPFNIIGPGQPEHLVPQTFINRLRGDPGTIEVGDLSAVRDWIDVRDVASALIALAAPDAKPDIYNVATGQGVSVHDLLTLLLRISGHSPEIRMCASGAPPRGVSRSIGDATKIRSATGWKPEYALDDSLKHMLDTGGF